MRDASKGKGRFAAAVLVIAGIFGVFAILLMTYPYDNFSYGEVGPIITDEYTSDGIPVVRLRDELRWNQQYCNKGASPTVSLRWLELYGNSQDAGFVNLEDSTDEPLLGVSVPTVEFFAEQNVCETAEVFSYMPRYLSAGGYYKFRIETSYKPNPIRTITESTETELFLLLREGDPVP